MEPNVSGDQPNIDAAGIKPVTIKLGRNCTETCRS